MLTEDQVVDAVADYLRAEGWTILSVAHAHQHGDDIVAERGKERLIIEAKGEGSSKAGTSRYGSPFDRGQVRTHVAVAVLRALGVVSTRSAYAAVAFPDNAHHRQIFGAAAVALSAAGVGVYWVGANAQVTDATYSWPAR